MANVEDERLSGEEDLTLEELRSKLAQMNLPISGARSVLVTRLNRACRTGRSTPKESKCGEEPTNQRDLRSRQRAERSQEGEEDLEKLRTKELRVRLVSLGLKVTGRKSELRARLQTALEGNDVSSEEESDDESEDEDDKKGVREYRRGMRAVYQDRDECYQRAYVGSRLSFRDVEDALESFSGNKGENVERWFESFEEVADTCMWSDGQKAIYARRLLKGSAKIFARFECRARTWHELKRGLVKEFSKKVNSRQVHQELIETKKKSDEACLAYMYRMLEIARHVDIEEEAKVEYIVDGIVDDESNKSMLYGATSIKELRKRLMMYEEQKSRKVKAIVKLAETEGNKEPSRSGDARKARCYNCGDTGHVCVECPSKSRGPKCFKCREYGHVASKCDNSIEFVKEVASVFPLLKTVKIRNFELSALIGTGSELTLMRADQYVKIGAPRLGQNIVEFRGIGSERNCTLGEFSTNVLIDNESYDMTIHVVSNTLMQHSLIIGTDFLDTVELNIKGGNASIRKVDIKTQQYEVIDQFQFVQTRS